MRNLRKKKIMIKLIASDIDGTLVKEGSHEISPEYFEVIEELKKVGIRFCACSGRQYASMLDLFRPIADDIFFISGNGTVVRTKEKLLHSWHLEQDIILPIIEAIRGIRCDRVMEGLVRKGLVRDVGRSEAVGRPILYGTTDEFLKQFGFETIKELPEIKDIEGLLDDETDMPEGLQDSVSMQQISLDDLSSEQPEQMGETDAV